MAQLTPSQQPAANTGPSARHWAWRVAAVAAGASVLCGAAAWAANTATSAKPAPAAASAAMPAPPQGDAGEGGPRGHEHGGRHGGHHGHGDMRGPGPMGGPGMMMEGPQLDRALDDVKATDAQRKQIRAIAEQARTDLKALHEQGRKLHEDGMALWAAPKLDEQAIEAHRQKMSALREQTSSRMAKAMLDAGKVLQPEQRAELVKRMQERHSRLEMMRAHFQSRMGEGRHAAPPAPASGPVH